MKIKIMYFAQLAEAVGMKEQEVELAHPVTIREFIQDFLNQPVFQKYKQLPFLYAINEEFVTPETQIENNTTLAILPPVAGG